MTDPNIRGRVVRGTVWVFITQVFTQAASLVKNIILARVLSPDDFGIFGIALVVFSLLEAFSRSGFDVALIQRKEDIRDYLNTAFVVNIGRGTFLFLLLFFSAPLVAMFFKKTEIVWVVRAVSLIFLLNGFTNPGTIYFSRQLEFKKQFEWEMSRTIVEIIVTLSLVFYLKNVWVLVIGMTASHLARVVFSYIIHPYRPTFSFNPDYARSLFRFGKWILGSGILVYLITQGDDAFVGKFLGITALGFYRIAYRFSNLPATHITHVISRVTFPAYSRLQEEKERLKKAYLEVLHLTAVLSAMLSSLIFSLGPEFVRLFLGEKWLPIIPALQILAVHGFLRSIGATTGPLFQAMGKPEIATKLQFVKLVLLVAMIYPLTKLWGIAGTSLTIAINTMLVMPVALFMAKKLSYSSEIEVVKAVVIPLIMGIFTGVVIFLLKMNMFQPITFTTFFIVLIVGCVSYVVCALVFDRSALRVLTSMVKQELFKTGRN